LSLFQALFSIHSANDLSYNIKNLDVQIISFQKDILMLNNQIKNKILDVLVDYFNQRHNLLKELMQIELIHGASEYMLFDDLVHPVSLKANEFDNINGRDLNGDKKLNANQFKEIVNKLMNK